jgi:hypothetical protein
VAHVHQVELGPERRIEHRHDVVARNGKHRPLVPVKWAFLAKHASQKRAWEAPGKQARAAIRERTTAARCTMAGGAGAPPIRLNSQAMPRTHGTTFGELVGKLDTFNEPFPWRERPIGEPDLSIIGGEDHMKMLTALTLLALAIAAVGATTYTAATTEAHVQWLPPCWSVSRCNG